MRERRERDGFGGARRRWLPCTGPLLGVLLLAVVMALVASACGGGQATEQAAVDPGGGHVLGPADAPVTIVEFADFQ